MQDHRQQLAEFFLYLCRELKVIVSVIKGYRSDLSYVFSLLGLDFTSSSH